MATIKLAVLRHTKAKDGSFKIRISIGHKSETHYIVTRYKVNSLNNFINGVVVNQPDANYINVKLRALLNDYDQRLDQVPNLGELSCQQLRDMLKDMRPTAQNTTLLSVANEYIKQLREEKRNTYAHLIEYHVKKFLSYTRGDIALQNITTITIDGYSHLLRSKGASPAYESICLMNIRTLVNRAIKLRLVQYDIHPFSYWRQQNGEPKELDISVENLRLLINNPFKPKKTRRAVDFFLLSYYLGGMNMADLLYYDFRGYKENPILHYQRRKTANKKRGNKTIEFTIQPEAYPIIDKYMNPKTGHLVEVSDSKYNTFLGLTNRALKRAAEKLGIHQRISFYSARKSFVQHGFELGIPLETLEYCIGQSMKENRPIFNYVKIMRQHADVAIRQILDNLKEENQ